MEGKVRGGRGRRVSWEVDDWTGLFIFYFFSFQVVFDLGELV